MTTREQAADQLALLAAILLSPKQSEPVTYSQIVDQAFVLGATARDKIAAMWPSMQKAEQERSSEVDRATVVVSAPPMDEWNQWASDMRKSAYVLDGCVLTEAKLQQIWDAARATSIKYPLPPAVPIDAVRAVEQAALTCLRLVPDKATAPAEQMTLGKFIDELEKWPRGANIQFDFAGVKPTGFDSYRGFYDQLALGFALGSRYLKSAGEVLDDAESAIGKAFLGWKGGSYIMDRDTPLWVANRGECDSTCIVGLGVEDYRSSRNDQESSVYLRIQTRYIGV